MDDPTVQLETHVEDGHVFAVQPQSRDVQAGTYQAAGVAAQVQDVALRAFTLRREAQAFTIYCSEDSVSPQALYCEYWCKERLRSIPKALTLSQSKGFCASKVWSQPRTQRCHRLQVTVARVGGGYLEARDGLAHVSGGVLREVDEADVAQRVAVALEGGGVHGAHLQPLPLQVDLLVADLHLRRRSRGALSHQLASGHEANATQVECACKRLNQNRIPKPEEPANQYPGPVRYDQEESKLEVHANMSRRNKCWRADKRSAILPFAEQPSVHSGRP